MTEVAGVRIGAEVSGYRVEELIGRGGMGEVYRAWDERLERNVALKILIPRLADDDAFRERLLRESRLAASLDHPNVVPVYDAGEAVGRFFLVMRYVEGTDLRAVLRGEGALSPERAIDIAAQVAGALDAAHERGLVHRDVKPSNVLIDERGHCYLADFGLTQLVSSQGQAPDGSLLGTLDYVAPEQIRGSDVDSRADVYALGCLLFECLTGEVPFARPSEVATLYAHLEDEPPRPSERNPALPEAIDAVISTAIAKDPDDRYASCSELIEASSDALGLHRPVTIRDRKALILTAVGVAIAAAAVLAGVLLSRGGGPGKPSTKPTLTPKVDSLQRIDPKTNNLVATIGGVGSNPIAIAVGAGSVWVGSLDDGTVSRVDPKTNAVRRTVNTGAPDAIVIRDGRVLVANQGYGSPLSSIDPAKMSATTSAQPGFGYSSLALGGGALWGLSVSGLDRINHGGQVVKTLTDLVPLDPFALAAGEGAVWVLDGALRSVFRVDPATNSVVRQLGLHFDPGGIAVGGGSVWVTDARGGAVARIDPRSSRLVARIPVGRDPVGVVVGEGSVWVANYESGTVSRIDPRSGTVVKTIPVGRYPATLATGEGGVWVAVRAA